jgi:hypothetical protein
MKRTLTLTDTEIAEAIRLWLFGRGEIRRPDEAVVRVCVDNVVATPFPGQPMRLRAEVDVVVDEGKAGGGL